MAAGWRVVNQRQYEELTPGGSFESTVEITFALNSGQQGKIKVPSRLYSAEYVAQAVATAAETMDAVQNLASQ